jgi:formate hydrogenlyase subunit 6/NADH:ubiquinone oxidoreductase subunit I
VASGGAILRYAIDYAKCMFCALCTEPCPTSCLHMGDIHDLSGYDRKSMIVEFTELARRGLQTPQPLWMQRDNLPEWADQTKRRWIERGHPLREKMLRALEETEIPKPPKQPAADKAAAKDPPLGKPEPGA